MWLIIQVPDTILVEVVIHVRVFDNLQKVFHRATVSHRMPCVINHHHRIIISLNYIPYIIIFLKKTKHRRMRINHHQYRKYAASGWRRQPYPVGMAEAEEGIDLWRVSGDAGKARKAQSVTSAGRWRWRWRSRSPRRRPPWFDRERRSESPPCRRDPRVARAPSRGLRAAMRWCGWEHARARRKRNKASGGEERREGSDWSRTSTRLFFARLGCGWARGACSVGWSLTAYFVGFHGLQSR